MSSPNIHWKKDKHIESNQQIEMDDGTMKGYTPHYDKTGANSRGRGDISCMRPRSQPGGVVWGGVDRKKFLEILSDRRKQYRVQAPAYCLMDHHDHLLIKTPR